MTEDFETAYARAVAEYERDLRLRRIQIGLRLCLLLFIVAVLGITAKLIILIVASTSASTMMPTATAPMTSTLRTTSTMTTSTTTTSTTTTSTSTTSTTTTSTTSTTTARTTATTTSLTSTTTSTTALTTTSSEQDWGKDGPGAEEWIFSSSWNGSL